MLRLSRLVMKFYDDASEYLNCPLLLPCSNERFRGTTRFSSGLRASIPVRERSGHNFGRLIEVLLHHQQAVDAVHGHQL